MYKYDKYSCKYVLKRKCMNWDVGLGKRTCQKSRRSILCFSLFFSKNGINRNDSIIEQ